MRGSRGVLAGASIMASATVGSAASLGLTVFVAHRQGVRVLGEYAVIATVYAVFGVVDSARTLDLTTRYAAGLGNERTKLRTFIAISGGLVACISALGFAVATDARAGEGALIAWIGAVVQIMTAELVADAQIRERFQFLAVALGVGTVVGSVVAALLLDRYGLVALGIGLAITSMLTRAILANPDGLQRFRHSPTTAETPIGQTGSLSVLGGAAQIVNVTDILAIRALSTAGAAGIYRAGSQLPTAVVALAYRGFDVLLPRLALRSEDQAARLVRRASPILAVGVGGACGLLIGLRRTLVRLTLGHTSHAAETILWIFALVWLINSIVHPAALLLIARRRQRSIVRLVLLEYAANLVLTLALVPPLGAKGSAIATLVTLSVSNLVLLPRILRSQLPALAVCRHLVFDCCLPAIVAVMAMITIVSISTS